jgi:Cu-Zn family superoxide dismutase
MIQIRKALALTVLVAAVVGAGVVGCSREEAAVVEETPTVEAPTPEPLVAVARMTSRAGLEIVGSISFTQAQPDAPTVIAARFEGLAEGTHGLHVHELGDCSSDDFKSAGGHFNPMGVPHAGPTDAERHAGDLGNIECGADGVCVLELESDLLTVEDGPASVVGRGVILHEKMDDLVSQPTGAAGSRLACGVVELEG